MVDRIAEKERFLNAFNKELTAERGQADALRARVARLERWLGVLVGTVDATPAEEQTAKDEARAALEGR